MALSAGTRLGTYQISGPLGAGGMGEVYRARDMRLGREVAIKVLPASVTASPERLARFEREARTVAGLNHPNIVTLFSVEEDGGTRFLTMELVEGQSLDRVVTAGGLPVLRVLDLAIPIANALAAAHERGVVHRDLKPGNVMVTHDGWVKVLDFGLAKVAAEPAGSGADAGTIGATVGAPISGEGQVLGTVPYMAPEQIRGEPVDARSDVFALGIMLYELATGQRPFTGATPADVSSAILRDAPVPVVAVRLDLPRDLNRIIARCLEKNPRDRFQTARDVSNELRYVQKEIESGAISASSSGSGVRGALGSTPSAVGGGGGATTPTPPSSRASGVAPATPAPGSVVPSIAVLPFVNRSRGEDDEYFSDGLADELLNVLTKVRGLRVAARASSFQFKGKNEDLAVIGERLNVATLLDGSVRKSGNRVRISVQLVKADDRIQLWSETYDRSLDDIFAVQDDIAQSVVKELRTALLGEAPDSAASGIAKDDVAQAAKGHGQNPEAYRLYLQGKHFVSRTNPEDNLRGIRLLEDALRLDPTLALAWTELSRAHGNSGGYGWAPVREGYRRALEAAERALALAPDLAEAHVRLAAIHRMHTWDRKAARASIQRAVELAPGNPDVMRAAASEAETDGRFKEAEDLYKRACEQDPLNPNAYSGLASSYRLTGRFEEAATLYQKAMDLAPQRIGTHLLLSVSLAELGRVEEALAAARGEPAEWARLTALAYAHTVAGHTKEADEALQALIAGHAVDSPYQIAAIYVARRDKDAAFEWLNRAVDEKDAGMAAVLIERIFRPLHDDPRWAALKKRLGAD